jgi:UDPglucose 6-dehydrogenase
MTLNMSMPGTMGSAKVFFKNQYMIAKVGIVGMGFVGGAIDKAMRQGFCSVVAVDPPKGYLNTYRDLLECEGVFVCVPSPQDDDGTCDTSILEDVLANLNKINYQGVIISKCTAPPDVYERLNNLYPNLVHAPEFLTAANANRDYANAKWSIIGGSICAYRHEAERIIKLTQSGLEIIKFCSIGDAALAKYAINSFLATKVIFMNELYQLAEKAGLNYDVVTNLIKQDDRIGDSHMRVPGTDGSLGFGGYCFPKDTSALLKYAEQVKAPLNVLESAVKKNTLLRLTEPK